MKYLLKALPILLLTWHVPMCFSQALVTNPCGAPAGAQWTLNAPCVNVTTAGLGPLFNPGSCNSGAFDNGWAWFTGDGNTATITFAATAGDPVLHVFSAALPCTVTELGCADITLGGGTETVTIPTTLGVLYFIRLQNWGTNTTMTGCLDVQTTPPPPPADYTHPTAFINNEKVGACLVTDCGPFIYSDDGGTTGNYSDNIPGIYSPANAIYRVFCPDAAGQCMRATFTEFVTANANDVLWVRDGPTEFSPNFTSAPTATTLWPSPPANPAFDDGLFGNLTASTPFSFQSTDASGCLTFAFVSSSVNNAAGWTATLECIPCAGGPNGTDNNDCQRMTPLCAGTAVAGNSTGPGIVAEGCNGTDCPAGGENHTNWYTFQAFTTGTLNITMTPVAPTDDYDFAIYGPNVTCAALGPPIRCTDSGVQGTTGLTGAAGDLIENVSGDSYLQTMNVIAGQTYILVVDEWSSGAGGGYALTFGGTASLDCIILPVELTEFEAEYVPNEDIVDLYWKTESERDNDFFQVQRSTNGVDFTDIATVKGVGNSTMETSYYTVDKDPAVGINYYRLEQFDINGNSSYSDLKSVNILDDAYDILSVAPNPTKGVTELIYNCYESGESILKVYDQNGKLLEESVLKSTAGANRAEINLSTQRGGMYMITLNTNHKSYTAKIIKE
jgi:hypothetical protein